MMTAQFPCPSRDMALCAPFACGLETLESSNDVPAIEHCVSIGRDSSS
jgi:hypothetical protein